MKHPDRVRAYLGADQADALARFTELVETRAIPLGLVSARDAGRVFARHVLDSVRAAVVIGREAYEVADIGSGAGLPGVPLAIVLPRSRFTLVEPRARRVGFLELAIEHLGLRNVSVARARIEELDAEFDVATARAFRDLGAAWRAAHRVLRPGGRLVFFAGGRFDAADAARAQAPEPPAAVALDPVLERATPLVIMTRG